MRKNITLRPDMERKLFGDKKQITAKEVARNLKRKWYWLAWVIGSVDKEFFNLLKEEIRPSNFSNSQTTPLHEAADRGNHEILEDLIEWGCGLEVRDFQGFTALHVAIMRGSEECVRKLLQLGASPERPTKDSYTPLFIAVYSNKGILRRLLRAGADPNRKVSGFSPLHRAVARGDRAMVFTLLSNGADVNIRDEKGNTPLHVAAMRNRDGIIPLLLSSGVKKSAQNKEKQTALQIAKERGRKLAEKALRA